MSARARGLALALAAMLVGVRAGAQDFAGPSPPGPASGPLAAIERALPRPLEGAALEIAGSRWLGLASLEGAAAGLGIGWRGARLALGVSQTGDPAIGWNAAGLALGAAGPEGGGALRAVARRDRTPLPDSAAAFGPGVGLEAGAGAWVRAGGLTAWASAPQVWTGGAPPPLARPLALGARLEGPGLAGWFAWEAPERSHRAGLELGSGALVAWVEARDGPLRGALGLGARLGRLALAISVESHPVLGETTHLSLALGAGP